MGRCRFALSVNPLPDAILMRIRPSLYWSLTPAQQRCARALVVEHLGGAVVGTGAPMTPGQAPLGPGRHSVLEAVRPVAEAEGDQTVCRRSSNPRLGIHDWA